MSVPESPILAHDASRSIAKTSQSDEREKYLDKGPQVVEVCRFRLYEFDESVVTFLVEFRARIELIPIRGSRDDGRVGNEQFGIERKESAIVREYERRWVTADGF